MKRGIGLLFLINFKIPLKTYKVDTAFVLLLN